MRRGRTRRGGGFWHCRGRAVRSWFDGLAATYAECRVFRVGPDFGPDAPAAFTLGAVRDSSGIFGAGDGAGGDADIGPGFEIAQNFACIRREYGLRLER